jgi:hypothetical protein
MFAFNRLQVSRTMSLGGTNFLIYMLKISYRKSFLRKDRIVLVSMNLQLTVLCL